MRSKGKAPTGRSPPTRQPATCAAAEGAAPAPSPSSSSESEDEVLSFLAKKVVQQQQQTKRATRSKKNLQANVHWRSISTEELRSHPLYTSLPPPETVAITSPRDFALIRQGSWQWDALHSGRLTTSKAACCLGFYEAKASGVLGVPKGLTGHGRVQGAWQQLATEKLLCERDWALLRTPTRSAKPSAPQPPTVRSSKPSVPQPPSAPGLGPSSCWTPSPAQQHPFSHTAPRYVARRGYSSVSSARLAWGSAQESTAIVQAINFIHAQNAAGGMGGLVGRVCEVGLLPAEALACEAGLEEPLAALSLSGSLPPAPPPSAAEAAATVQSLQQLTSAGLLPPLGASPDGLVRYYSSSSSASCCSCEVIEVKCSSPFVTGPRDTIAVSPRPAPPLGSWHMPQLQLEILCAGPACTGALLVVMTALQGATIYRVPRDDGYIAEMLHWLGAFTARYLAPPPPPPPSPVGASFATKASTHPPSPPSGSLPAAPRAPERDFFSVPLASQPQPQPQPQSQSPEAYRQFLLRTVRLAARAVVVKRLEEGEVQRSKQNVDLLI